MRYLVALTLVTFFSLNLSAETTCSNIDECESVVESATSRIEEFTVDNVISENETMIESLVSPNMGPFATDDNGELSKMSFKKAAQYCARQGKVLPTALDFMLISKLSGAELTLLNIENEQAASRIPDGYRTLDGANVPSWAFGHLTPFGFPAQVDKGIAQNDPLRFSFKIPENFEQKNNSLQGATFWTRTVDDSDTDFAYIYGGSSGRFRYENIRGGLESGRYKFQEHSVVCVDQ